MSNKHRILLITPLPPPVHGSSMVSQWIKDSKLLNEEFDMDFVNLSTSRKVEEIQKVSLRLYVIKLWRFIGAYICVLWHLCTKKYDLCYLAITCHGTPFIKDYPFVMLCKLFRRRIIIHQHNKGMREDVAKWPYNWMLPRAYNGAKVMLLSERLYSDIKDVVSKDQILICPNGIPPIAQSEEVAGKPETPHILFLSNLIESKGVYVLLDACKILKDQGLEFVCDFVGGSTKEISKEVFKTATRSRGLEDIAIYHGPQYGQDKEQFWQQSSVFAFPTYYENECFPLVILEAMQHHLPVVTSDEGGIPDIVINDATGYICKNKEAASFAKAIEQLLLDPTLQMRMGKAGYERFTNHFTLKHFEDQIMYILNACIE